MGWHRSGDSTGMATRAPSPLFDRLRQRVDTLPLDRAPLRRAGLLTVLLIVLLGLGKAFSPAPARSADRQEVQSETEEVSAPRSSTAWTGGRVLAILFLLTGGGIAFWMHRRAGGRVVSGGSTLRVLETHPLGPNQSLRLVACGEEVLLLSVASEGAVLLRHWPQEVFETEPVSFASALASLTSEDDRAPSPSASSTPHTASPLPAEEDPTAKASSQPEISASQQNEGFSDLHELATAPPEPAPVIARGTLFPPRTHAPHQFAVRHG